MALPGPGEGADGERAWLQAALAAATPAGGTRHDQMAARWQALELSRQSCGLSATGQGPRARPDVVGALAEAVAVVKDMLPPGQRRGAHVGQCVRALRDAGFQREASRLRKAAGARNAACHPDPGLLDDLQAAVARATAARVSGEAA